MTDSDRLDKLTDAAQEERRIEEGGPCIHCGAYDGDHDEGCSYLEDK
jgi:hypothetical protein